MALPEQSGNPKIGLVEWNAMVAAHNAAAALAEAAVTPEDLPAALAEEATVVQAAADAAAARIAAEDLLTETAAKATYQAKTGAFLDARDFGTVGTGAAIQAAYDALPTYGGTILLDDVEWDVGAGLQFGAKPCVLRASSRVQRRYMGSNPPTARITSTGTPVDLINITPASGNVYGYRFEGLYFDMTKPSRAGIYTVNVGMAVVEDCAFVVQTGAPTGVVGIYATGSDDVTPSGADSAWWVVKDCFSSRVTFIKSVPSVGGQGGTNRWKIDGVVAWGGRDELNVPRGTIMDFGGGAGIQVTNTSIETCEIGIKATNNVGCRFSPEGETISDVMISLIDCSNCVTDTHNVAGTFPLHVRDLRGLANDHRGAPGKVQIIDPKVGTGNTLIATNREGRSPAAIAPGGLWVNDVNHSGQLFGSVIEHGAEDMFPSHGPFIAEYWDGSAWVTWSGPTFDILHEPNGSITADATSAKWRLRNTSSLNGESGGILVLRLNSTPHGAVRTPITVELLDASLLPLADPQVIDHNATNKGTVFYAVPTGVSFVRVGMDMKLTGGQTWTIGGLGLYVGRLQSRAPHTFHTRRTPVGNISGRPGQTAVDVSGGKVWHKSAGFSTTTGWHELARSVSGSVTWDPPNIIAGAVASTTVTATGAAVGDTATATHAALSVGGAFLVAQVTAADTVTVTLVNLTGADLNLASGALRVRVLKQ